MSEKIDDANIEGELGITAEQAIAAAALAPMMGHKILAIRFDDEANVFEIEVETGATLQIRADFDILGLPQLSVSLK